MPAEPSIGRLQSSSGGQPSASHIVANDQIFGILLLRVPPHLAIIALLDDLTSLTGSGVPMLRLYTPLACGMADATRF